MNLGADLWQSFSTEVVTILSTICVVEDIPVLACRFVMATSRLGRCELADFTSYEDKIFSPPDDVDFGKWTVADLKKYLRVRSASQTGKKSALVEL